MSEGGTGACTYGLVADGAEGLQVVQRALAPAAVDWLDVVYLPKVALHWSADHLVELRGSRRWDNT